MKAKLKYLLLFVLVCLLFWVFWRVGFARQDLRVTLPLPMVIKGEGIKAGFAKVGLVYSPQTKTVAIWISEFEFE